MAEIYLRGDVEAILVLSRVFDRDDTPPVPMLQLKVGEARPDYVRLWPADPDKLDALAGQISALAEQERTRRVEVLKKRQNLREDHRGEVSMSGPISLDSGGVSVAALAPVEDEDVSAVIVMPPPEDSGGKVVSDTPSTEAVPGLPLGAPQEHGP